MLMALLLGLGLWWFVRPDRAAVQLVAAALLLALAGYAWQGHPDLAGRPKDAAQPQEAAPSGFAQMHADVMGQFNRAAQWLTMAQSYQSTGDTRSGVEVIGSGIRSDPNDPILWTALGDALVQHAGGMMTPAAQLAFNRAAAIAPSNPWPRFFYGLSLAESGHGDQAEQVWRQLLASAPADAPWRADLEQRVQALEARIGAQTPPTAQ
ncbi:MAG: hypothetical protein JO157_11335 [Acetobacteraceae bacterium]|nr:hypothetical protein [Acetobacteraceae bacterium]